MSVPARPIRASRPAPRRPERPRTSTRLSPAQVIVASFAAAIAVGTAALTTPAASTGRAPTLLEAAFTATSAATVTGLGVVDTATFWTGFGQAVILMLIQVGGLGVMTFTSLLGLLVMRRLGLTRRLDVAASSRTAGIGDLPRVLVTWMVMYLVLEGGNPRTLGGLGPGERLLAAFFQSVTTRTAGGVKITTAGVLLFVVLTEIRGDAAVHALGRRLSRSTHREAITVLMLSATVIVVATMLIMGMTAFSTDQVVFECVSAFATVGLSTGITAQLPPAAQLLLLMLLMFLGRIGPATVAGSLAMRRRTRHFEYPKERPLIG